ncbi:MAG: chitinase [Flavobacteriales bacterium]|nr:chitinase [Flavobacteriales bacterium]
MYKTRTKLFLMLFLNFIFPVIELNAQNELPNPALIGYFQNWHSKSADYIPLNEVDARYNVIIVSFALPKSGTTYNIHFKPEVDEEEFIKQIKEQKQKGKKVLISVGGATAKVQINSRSEMDIFTYSVSSIVEKYDFDGVDINFEGESIALTGGTIDQPIDPSVDFLIAALKRLKSDYKKVNNTNLLLTVTPETANVHGGQTRFRGSWGSYLPIIQGLKNEIDLLQIQLYNSGSMYGVDGEVYEQGTADFIIAMTEALIYGFDTYGGEYYGFPSEKVAVGLPACEKAAGSGYVAPEEVKKAIDYLTGKSAPPGKYTLQDPYGYPNLRGLMTWSINWDHSDCSKPKEFASNFKEIFSRTQLERHRLKTLKFYPVAGTDWVQVNADKLFHDTTIQITTIDGELMLEQINLLQDEICIDLSCFENGLYLVKLVSPTKGTFIYKTLRN